MPSGFGYNVVRLRNSVCLCGVRIIRIRVDSKNEIGSKDFRAFDQLSVVQTIGPTLNSCLHIANRLNN